MEKLISGGGRLFGTREYVMQLLNFAIFSKSHIKFILLAMNSRIWHIDLMLC